ncbi:g6884 [Coccomyxa elongata]
MPSVNGVRRGTGVRQQPALPRILTVKVNNIIGLDKYYRSATLLLRQADEYRRIGDDYQLYTMLMRFASLVLETIPHHEKFRASSPEHMRLKKLLMETYMPELEQLKVKMATREKEGVPMLPPMAGRTENTTQLVTSNLTELSNWGVPLPAAPRPPQDMDFGRLSVSGDLLSGDMLPSTSAAPPSATAESAELPSWMVSNSSLRLPVASEAARNRHALMPSLEPARRVSAPNGGVAGPLYPAFDRSPLPAIDYGSIAPSAPPLPHSQQAYSQQQQQHSASLLDAVALQLPASDNGELLAQLQHPSPQVELQLGPQEWQVQSVPTPTQAPSPGETCSLDVEVVPPLGTDQPGGAPPKQQQGIREVQVSMALMDEFLKYAISNTRRGIESCGILAGVLDEKNSCFQITTLIIPKQEGTSDTVQALNEEEIFEAQDSRSLYPLGWIHTHPTQTCFLSSIDVHTQCGYQTMLEEAIAIVMAPRDARKRCGLFRLSTPGGLQLVQKCPERGFHAHPPTSTSQPVYELCGHVYLNPRVGHEVIDLR